MNAKIEVESGGSTQFERVLNIRFLSTELTKYAAWVFFLNATVDMEYIDRMNLTVIVHLKVERKVRIRIPNALMIT